MIPSCIRNIGVRTSKRSVVSYFLNKRDNYATEATLDTTPFRLHKLDAGPSNKVAVTKKDAVDMYTKMHTIRRLSSAASSLYMEKLVRGFCHLYAGQEACAVGITSAMRPQDSLITAYRAHGFTYLMTNDAGGVLAELTGRQGGNAKGKGGSMHMYADNFYGGNGIVGAQVPIGVGVNFANKHTNTDSLCITLYGDGAANQGQVHEVYNISKLWNLPVIYVCENNQYAMGTAVARASYNTAFYTRGDYIPGVWVDGMDVLAVREATKFAMAHCIAGKGPIILETETYRYGGHSMADPGTSYRTREEVQEVRQTKDPINTFKEKILNSNLVTQDEIKAIEDITKKTTDDAVKFAKESPELPVTEVGTNIYLNCLEKSIRNVTPFIPLDHKSKVPGFRD